ncbi:MAG: LacI family transcriptional regulator [Candidatus Omnitrophica bacterium]|nr:LacI family transcriptional regulator [Candidatus Omnitrophota bacterium]
MVTIKEIAKKAKVSPATVSKALSGTYGVSSKTRKRVKKLAEELRYIPDYAARSLVTNKSFAIGLVTPYLANPALIERIRGIQNRCLSNQYVLITCFYEKDTRQEEKQIETLLSRKVDGLIITPIAENDELKNFIKKIDIPVVLLSEMLEGLECDFVGEDDYEGGRIATEHLIKLGHRNIAYFGNSPDVYSDRCITKGYKDTLEKYEIKFSQDYIFWGNTDKEILGKNIEKVLSFHQQVTGIICWSDIIAVEIVKKLESMNIKVPEDISVVGYDNIEMLSIFHMSLTTIGQPNFLIGQKAVSALLPSINGANLQPPQKIILKPELIIRNSTGQAKIKN